MCWYREFKIAARLLADVRSLGIVAIVIGLAFIIASTLAHAKQDQTKPDMAQMPTGKAIDTASDIPPCFAQPNKPKHVWWVLTARDGTTLIVGDEGVRKRC